MIRHIFSTNIEHTPVIVVAGFDRKHSLFFIHAERLSKNGVPNEKDTLLSSIMPGYPSETNLEPLSERASRIGITLPKEMIQELAEDALRNSCKKTVCHCIEGNGRHVRKVIGD